MTLRSHVLLLNNSVFGKRMENVKIYGDETDDKRAIAIHYFFTKHVQGRSLYRRLIHGRVLFKKGEHIYHKQVYVGTSILDLSRLTDEVSLRRHT